MSGQGEDRGEDASAEPFDRLRDTGAGRVAQPPGYVVVQRPDS